VKKVFSLLILVIIFTDGCKNSANKPETGALSQMDFKRTTFNFGAIPNGSVNKCIFEFRNTSKTPLIINNVIVSCGCTSPKWPKKPILPGEKGIIEVRYNAAGAGLFRKSISVFSNARNSPVHFFIKGVIIL